jgi:hypothetical protein
VTSPAPSDDRVELVWDLAQKNISNQFAALDELRTRIGTLFGAATIANGFLSAQSFAATHGFPFGAWIAVASAVLLAAVIAYVLWPRNWRVASIDTHMMLEDIDAHEYTDINHMRRYMSDRYQEGLAVNDVLLRRLYHAFSLALGLLVVNFAGWFWALTHR